MAKVDEKLGDFLAQLEALGLREVTDVVLTTDHGMTDETGKVRTEVSRFVDPDDAVKILHSEAFVHLALANLSQVEQESQRQKQRKMPDGIFQGATGRVQKAFQIRSW